MGIRLEWPAKRRELVRGFTIGEWVVMMVVCVGMVVLPFAAWVVRR